MTSVLSSPLSQTMAMTASSLDGPVDVDELLYLICLAAIDSVPGAEYAGITIANRHGKLGDARGHPSARVSPLSGVRSSSTSTPYESLGSRPGGRH